MRYCFLGILALFLASCGPSAGEKPVAAAQKSDTSWTMPDSLSAEKPSSEKPAPDEALLVTSAISYDTLLKYSALRITRLDRLDTLLNTEYLKPYKAIRFDKEKIAGAFGDSIYVGTEEPYYLIGIGDTGNDSVCYAVFRASYEAWGNWLFLMSVAKHSGRILAKAVILANAGDGGDYSDLKITYKTGTEYLYESQESFLVPNRDELRYTLKEKGMLQLFSNGMIRSKRLSVDSITAASDI